MTRVDLNMYFILNTVKMLSGCKDKQVAAISVYDNSIIGLSWNKPVLCNGLCNHKCGAIHAEEGLNLRKGCTVYLNLFPCENCQRTMSEHGVKHVIVFGEQHKPIVPDITFDILCLPNIVSYLPKYNGQDKQRLIEAGECGELITAIANSTRTDREQETQDIVSEEVDVMLQLMINSSPEFAGMFRDKIEKLTKKFLPDFDGAQHEK